MKLFIVLSLLAAAALADDLYDESKTNLDVDELVSNERLLKGYCACFLGKGPCTAEGVNIKKFIPDAVQNACSKCSPRQRSMVRKMCQAIKEKLPADWQELAAAFDPQGQYKSKVDAFLAASD
ncbi:allergen Tha p 1 [Plutella xylostella]|uniref:allergen Tha p 1 n=1 Tax=Plutella xylostella TaxID=51655 RepID=UPI0020327B6A|nr:allergen Tha p 1 [Plutella xylostella]